MSTTIFNTSVYNVEATMNSRTRAALTDITRPSWLSDMPTIVSDAPEKTAIMPAFSFHHIPVGDYDQWQGRGVGDGKAGLNSHAIFEVSCWVTRDTKDWVAQLRTMKDMVRTVFTKNIDYVIQDYATSQSSPADTAFLIRLKGSRVLATAADVNPDVERCRILIDYEWVYRS